MKRREVWAGMTSVEILSMIVFIAVMVLLAIDAIMQPLGY
jgi:Tfp pilus assembly protein FimT